MDETRYRPPQQGAQPAERYSPEEMMARLKKNERQKQQTPPREQGELITREDGTQVVKVRRRKRRSQQPSKSTKKKKNSKVKWFFLGSIAAVCLALVVGSVIIIAKYNGASFKKQTEANISKLSGASQVELTQIRVTPISAKAKKVSLKWDQHHFLESAEFYLLEADILATSFLGSTWDGEEIVSPEGKVFLQTPPSLAEYTTEPMVSPYNFGTYRCNQLDLLFGKDQSAPAITGMQTSYWTLPDGKSRVSFNNGTMKIDNWPTLRISSGVATLNRSDIDIEALLEAGDTHQGEITIKGNINKNTTKPIILDVKAKHYPVQELLGKGLGRIIRGKITSDMGSLQYNYNKPTNQALSFIMPFNSNEIRMTELPMFEELKNLTGDTQYVLPVFNHCSGTLLRTNEGITIDHIDFKSTSKISLTGKIKVDNTGKLSGALTVGLPRRLFNPNSPPPGFEGPVDGLYKAQVTLGGTIHIPHDNLQSIIRSKKSPTKASPPNNTPPTTKEDMEKTFDDLVR